MLEVSTALEQMTENTDTERTESGAETFYAVILPTTLLAFPNRVFFIASLSLILGKMLVTLL